MAEELQFNEEISKNKLIFILTHESIKRCIESINRLKTGQLHKLDFMKNIVEDNNNEK